MPSAAQPPATRLKAVGFDLDGTLHDRDTSLAAFVASQHSKFALEPYASLATWREHFIALDAGGMVWKDKVYQALTTEWQLPWSWQKLLADYEDNFAESARPFPDAIATLVALKSRGLALGLITNGKAKLQAAVIASLGIEGFFSTILISETEGLAKPDPLIFARLLEKLSVSAENVAFVGDSLRADVEGAHKAGLYSIWLNHATPASLPETADAVVHALAEVTSLPRISECA
ncbi:MAG TPA: HAD family hydrolase [Rhodocyclaceae bacterium]|nr:HAD family hydrolase [Rhodocyclaceae bacterium]